MTKEILSASRVSEILHYDAGSGDFTWKVRLSNRVSIGDKAGSLHKPSGYWFIFIDGSAYKAHRLAMLVQDSVWPAEDVDHINGVRSDNRLVNLRKASRAVNQQNLRQSRGETASGLLGVYRTDKKLKQWKASICVGMVDKHLGNFATKEEAHLAYITAKRKLHQGCTI